MANVWRIGSDYGGKDVLPYFKENKVVFAGEPHPKYREIQEGNLIAITKGQDIRAIAKAKGFKFLSHINKDLANEFGDILGVLVNPIYWEEDFRKDFGKYHGRGTQFNQAHNEYKAHINYLFSKIKSLSMIKTLKNALSKEKQLILQGPPGTGKTRKAKQIAIYSITGETPDNDEEIKEKVEDNNDQIKLIQFHPAYNYDDFVRGLVPKPGPNGNLTFKPENKVLLDIADKAKNNTNNSYFLIIDEINRANLPAVLGELIYALEYRDTEVDCLYPESFDDDGEDNRKISLPTNLYIIGTMNTADRSVGTLDYAIRRRFAFEHLSPDPENVLSNGEGYNLYKKVEAIFGQVKPNESGNQIKWQLETSNHLSAEFDFNDVMIGHSYFMAANEEELQNNLKYKIKPILREYAKDGVLIDNGGDVMTEIENLKLSENND